MDISPSFIVVTSFLALTIPVHGSPKTIPVGYTLMPLSDPIYADLSQFGRHYQVVPIDDYAKYPPTVDTLEELGFIDMSIFAANVRLHKEIIDRVGIEAIGYFAPLAKSIDLQGAWNIDDRQIKSLTDRLKGNPRLVLLPLEHRCFQQIRQESYCGQINGDE